MCVTFPVLKVETHCCAIHHSGLGGGDFVKTSDLSEYDLYSRHSDPRHFTAPGAVDEGSLRYYIKIYLQPMQLTVYIGFCKIIHCK